MGHVAQSIGQIGTWIPTWTGFSADPTNVVASYSLNGKLCTVTLFATAGTSNATTTTVTLPFTASTTQINYLFSVDNGTNQVGSYCRTRLNSTIMDCYRTPATATWTASGNKNVYFTFTYIIA